MRAALLLLAVALLAGCAEPTPTPPSATTGNVAPTVTAATPSPIATATPSPPPLPTTEPPPAPPAVIPCDKVEAPVVDAAWRPERPQVVLNTTVGDVTLALDLEAAPITVGNFLNLTRAGFYDGVTFHRVIKGLAVWSGDPTTKDGDPSNDGYGGPGYSIPDELTPALRHDAPGVVTMWTSGPDTGGSQFFITLAGEPRLDDRHSAFGRVVSGMEVVDRIANASLGERDRPVDDIVVASVRVTEPAAFDEIHALGVRPVIASKRVAEGGNATFAVILSNAGSTRDAIALTAELPEGWTCGVDRVPVVPAGTARVVFLRLGAPANASGEHSIRILARGAWSPEPADASVVLTVGGVGEQIDDGDHVRAHYAGLLPDGRLFDSSMEAVATDPEQPKLETLGGFQPSGRYQPFEFDVGAGVIPGFAKLAASARVGETVTMLIPWPDAYAQGNMYEFPLAKRDLVFELEIIEKAG